MARVVGRVVDVHVERLRHASPCLRAEVGCGGVSRQRESYGRRVVKCAWWQRPDRTTASAEISGRVRRDEGRADGVMGSAERRRGTEAARGTSHDG